MASRERTATYWIGRINSAFAEEDRKVVKEEIAKRRILPTAQGPHPEHLGFKSARQIDSGSGQVVDGAIKIIAGGLRLTAGVAGATVVIGAGLTKDGLQMVKNVATKKPLLESLKRKRD